MTSIVDLRRDFFGGSIDEEKAAIAAALDEGITFADLIEAAQNIGINEVWLDSGVLQLSVGSPALSGVNSRHRGWLLDAATDEAVYALRRIPSDWTTLDARIYWQNAGAGAGDVCFDVQILTLADGATTGGTYTSIGSVTVTAPAQNVAKVTQVVTDYAVDPTKLLALRFIRDADNVADTLANDIALFGVLLGKAL